MAKINVTQVDIDNCDALSLDGNCVALAIKRIKRRDDVRVLAFTGLARIGKRKYELPEYAINRLVLHAHRHKIEPFEFELN